MRAPCSGAPWAQSPVSASGPVEVVARRIRSVRARRVMLDSDLAELYGVSTRVLNQAVKRNSARFPRDFVFQLTLAEAALLRSQVVTSNEGRGGRRYAPFVFTEHGAIMAATVLNSPRAVHMSIFVVRAFVQLRHLTSTHKELAAKLAELEGKVSGHDKAIAEIISAIRKLTALPEPRRRGIGFTVDI